MAFHGSSSVFAATLVGGAASLGPAPALARGEPGGPGCDAVAGALGQGVHAGLQQALRSIAANEDANGGFGNEMWGAIVDPNGVVCALAFSGDTLRDQWLGGRVIAAQKANTAVLFNLPAGAGGTVDALSTANLYALTRPGGSLFGLQFSNPVDPAVAYGDNAAGADAAAGADTTDVPAYGAPDDPLVGRYIGGVNVFGGGLGLYDAAGNVVGGLGVSGDTSCADHNVAWRVRDALGLDDLTGAGVRGPSRPPFQDDIIYDISGDGGSESGFGHPLCGLGEESASLPPAEGDGPGSGGNGPDTDDDEPAVLTVIGVLTDEGVECPAMRDEDGRLYTLATEDRDLGGLMPGDRVRVVGTRAEISFCMQGIVLAVRSIEAAP